jgi:hypothetical protein
MTPTLNRWAGGVSILVIVTSSGSRKTVAQDRHQGRRTTLAFFAMTQNPAAPWHRQHTCMDSPDDLADDAQ